MAVTDYIPSIDNANKFVNFANSLGENGRNTLILITACGCVFALFWKAPELIKAILSVIKWIYGKKKTVRKMKRSSKKSKK